MVKYRMKKRNVRSKVFSSHWWTIKNYIESQKNFYHVEDRVTLHMRTVIRNKVWQQITWQIFYHVEEKTNIKRKNSIKIYST